MSNNLPEWTAQAFVAAGAVFLLISAYWMGVYVPNAKELSDDFDFNQDEIFDDNEEYRSPGWARLKKKLIK